VPGRPGDTLRGALLPLVDRHWLSFFGSGLQVLESGKFDCRPVLRSRFDLRIARDVAVSVLVNLNGPRDLCLYTYTPRTGNRHESDSDHPNDPELHRGSPLG